MIKTEKPMIRASIGATFYLDEDTLEVIDGSYSTDVVSIKDGEFFEPKEFMHMRISLHVLEKIAEELGKDLRDD